MQKGRKSGQKKITPLSNHGNAKATQKAVTLNKGKSQARTKSHPPRGPNVRPKVTLAFILTDTQGAEQ
jgi:hypothetical protein